MKLTAIILLAGSLHLSARGVAQITLSEKKAPLEKVLQSVKAQSGYDLFYDEDLVRQKGRPVDIEVHDLPLEQALNLIFQGQVLTYTVSGRIITVQLREETKPAPLVAVVPPPIDVHGRVTDSAGNPLAGASVTVKGSKKGTVTGARGEFEIKGAQEGMMLEISFTGYRTQEVKVVVGKEVRVLLERSTSPLDEAQVIAYGTTTQRLSVGDVTTVKGEDIAKQPVSDPLLGLEGRVPGLIITPASGLPGSGVTVRIQGQNSISHGNDPLYVIDGVPYASQMTSTIGASILGYSGYGANGYGAGNPMSYINPSDIESISVLRDADATAIYGSRAANGAILITTKKGKIGKVRVGLDLQQGVSAVARMLPMMNTEEYLTMRREALTNDGLTANPKTDYDLTLWDTTRYTNWQKALIGGAAQYSNFSANVTGGTSNTQYLIGATYQNQTTVFPGNFDDQKGAAHLNLNTASDNERFRMQLAMNYQIDLNRLPAGDLTNNAIISAPDAPSLYNVDGSLNWMLNSAGASSWVNPLSSILRAYTSKVNNLLSNILLSYELFPGLSFRSSFGYTNLQQEETLLTPLIYFAPQTQSFRMRTATYGNSDINSWIIEPQLSYKHTIGKSKLEVLAGASIQESSSNAQQINGSGYNSDEVLLNITAATSLTSSYVAYAYKYDAVFGRIKYNWNDKYILDLTGRRDGSSRFGVNNEFQNFGSVGAGWIFSNEDMIKNTLRFLSFGKIRASYGTTGNDQIGDYQYLSTYQPTTPSIAYQGASGLVPTGLPNPYIQWETTKKIQLGLDLGFLRDRMLLNATVYRNRSSNELLNYALPINTGFNSISKNFPATVENSGIEFSFNTIVIKDRSFTWKTSFNLTIPSNKLVSFPNLAQSVYSSTFVVGKPFIGLTPIYRYAGVNPAVGEYEFYDYKGNLTYTPSSLTDRIDTVYLAPKSFGGFGNQFSYKGVDVDLFFQFFNQNAQNNFAGFTLPGYLDFNQPAALLNRWQRPGDIAVHQRYNQSFSIYQQVVLANSSNAGYSSGASYLRLKNAAISWRLPPTWISKIDLESARVFLQGENIWTLTKYKGGLDPETQSISSLPPLRTILFGIQAGF